MRPLDSVAILAAISLARRFIGCVAGRLLAYFSVNSAAANAWVEIMPVAAAAEATETVFKKRRRVMLAVGLPICLSPDFSFGQFMLPILVTTNSALLMRPRAIWMPSRRFVSTDLRAPP